MWFWSFYWRRDFLEWEKDLWGQICSNIDGIQLIVGAKDKWVWKHHDPMHTQCVQPIRYCKIKM